MSQKFYSQFKLLLHVQDQAHFQKETHFQNHNSPFLHSSSKTSVQGPTLL